MNKKLQEITDETIKELGKLEIVLPEIYTEIFFAKARELNIKIDEKDKEQALMYALKKIQDMKDATEKSASALKTHIQKARSAIVQKNDVELKNIENAVTALEKKIIDLQENLYIDELTQNYNRRWMYEKFLDAEKFKQDGLLAFIDIDNFKSVNDNYGHLTGDKVLKMIGALLRKVENTNVIRFAGDEFILISSYHNINKLSKLLEVIRNNLKSTNLKHENKIFNVSFSFGIINYKKGSSFKEIFKKADDLMYKNKKSKQ